MNEEETDHQINELNKLQSQIEKKLKKTFKELMRGEMHDPIYDISLSLKTKNQEIQNLRRQLAEANQIIRSNKYPKEGEHHLHQQFQISEDRLKNIEEMKKEARKEQLEYQNKTEQFVIFLIKCIRQLSDCPPQQLSQIPIHQIEKLVRKNQLETEANFSVKSETSNHLEQLKEWLVEEKGEKLFEKVSQKLELTKEWKAFIDEMENRYQQSKQIKELQNEMKGSRGKKLLEKDRVNALFARLKKVLFYLQAPEEDHHILNQIQIRQTSLTIKKQFSHSSPQLKKTYKQLIPFIESMMKEFFLQLHHLFETHNQGKQMGKEDYKMEDEVGLLIEVGEWEKVLQWMRSEIWDRMWQISRRMKFFTNKTKLINDLAVL